MPEPAPVTTAVWPANSAPGGHAVSDSFYAAANELVRFLPERLAA